MAMSLDDMARQLVQIENNMRARLEAAEAEITRLRAQLEGQHEGRAARVMVTTTAGA